jgi:hypothetical protein
MADEPYVNPFQKVHQQSATKRREPHLIEYQGATRCSVCKMPFPPDAKPSQNVAFAEHVLKAHRPGQTSEDVKNSNCTTTRNFSSIE